MDSRDKKLRLNYLRFLRVYLVSEYELFTLDENTKGTTGHCLKLRNTRCTRDITRHFLLTV